MSEVLEKVLKCAKERSAGKVGEKAAIEGRERVVYTSSLQAELDKILAIREHGAKCHQIAWRSEKEQRQAMNEYARLMGAESIEIAQRVSVPGLRLKAQRVCILCPDSRLIDYCRHCS